METTTDECFSKVINKFDKQGELLERILTSVSSQRVAPSPRFASPKTEKAEPPPDFAPADSLYHKTAASGILSWRSIQAIIGDTVSDRVTRDRTMVSARHNQTKRESVHGFIDSELDLESVTTPRL